jgi:transposase
MGAGGAADPASEAPCSADVRKVLNAVFYGLSSGCRWNALAKDPPPFNRSTASINRPAIIQPFERQAA